MHPRLLRLAKTEVQRALERLPPEVREAAEECAVSFEDLAEALEGDDTLEEDILGLFEGFSRLDPLPGAPDEMPCIRLFLDSIWEHVGGNVRRYRREVRITWLHELGHYLGWGEEEVEALGLG
ncbi:hypothetical protein FEM03_04605 [Phragmitibacter flavus]|uniref:Metallopeptidase family protein n=1 Tax=Phragmitibacter flavus TaxID=2576071 RepID=A0A5R8KID2_9BACT|nr:metallopeptidase family protein [Phragmitibacter flavus]TLD72010.1 hypothetical protein FEM03_04605 [Phragmitibacter flavus]